MSLYRFLASRQAVFDGTIFVAVGCIRRCAIPPVPLSVKLPDDRRGFGLSAMRFCRIGRFSKARFRALFTHDNANNNGVDTHDLRIIFYFSFSYKIYYENHVIVKKADTYGADLLPGHICVGCLGSGRRFSRYLIWRSLRPLLLTSVLRVDQPGVAVASSW